MRASHVMAALLSIAGTKADSRPNALVYRGPAGCEGCSESVGALLENSPWNFRVAYAGPNEETDFDEQSLKNMTVCAFPGGPDLDDAYESVKNYKEPLQKFVAAGGHYLGFCLGAYLAGHTSGFGLVPNGADVGSEIEQPTSQVKDDKDTVIQVDWTFGDGRTEKNKWLYFQEGAYMKGIDEQQGKILARYSKSGDVAASVISYGEGWVGLVGPHPEADESWYADENITSPDGISFDFAYDFIAETLGGGKLLMVETVGMDPECEPKP